MKKFIVTYHASAESMAAMANATPEQKAEGMKPWMEWKAANEDKIIDFGAPLMPGTRIGSGGTVAQAAGDITGFSILQAESLDVLTASLTNHPHAQWEHSSGIEVRELVSM